jgi:hypothetical protein
VSTLSSKSPPSFGGTQTLFTVSVPVTTPVPLRSFVIVHVAESPLASVIEPVRAQLPPIAEV